jgi:hypothetical protein
MGGLLPKNMASTGQFFPEWPGLKNRFKIAKDQEVAQRPRIKSRDLPV